MADPAEEEPAADDPTPEAGSGAEQPPGDPQADPSDAKKPEEAATDPERGTQHIADVIQVFNGAVRAGVVGTSRDRQDGKSHISPTGNLDDAEVAQDTAYYCKPDGFEEARQRLENDHMVTLCGRAGLGKRAGAVNLLRSVTNERLVVMSAVSDLKQLSTQKYTKEHGYLIVNRVETAVADDPDFSWRRVRDRVREAGAFLVVTTVSTADSRVEAVAQIAWSTPDLRAISRVHLVEREVSEEELDRIIERFDAEFSMADVATVLERLRDGKSLDDAHDALARTAERRVCEWFDDHRKSFPAVLDVAALAFLGHARYREFESLRDGLDQIMERHEIVKPAAEKPKKNKQRVDLPDRRDRLTDENGLITEKRIPGPTNEQLRVLAFRSDGYRQQVLVELSRRYETRFWNALAEWLISIVAVRHDAQVAVGLALLAAADFDEVDHSYLTPWSKGAAGTQGQATAVYILWAMCFAEDTLPIALKVAKQWANHGDPEQRWTAAMTYSGVLGAFDPAQAIRQLWQLISSSADGYLQACIAMAMLFGTLLGTSDAGKLLSTLEQQLHREPKRPIDRLVRLRARVVLAEVLILRENQDRVPATFLFLKDHDDRFPTVARLWAEGICFRPHRPNVLIALWHGLNRLRQVTDDPVAFATRLGEELIAALPPDEVEPFYQHFRTVDARARRGGTKSPPAMALLDVVERHYRRKAS
jgi:hypothetical protein